MCYFRVGIRGGRQNCPKWLWQSQVTWFDIYIELKMAHSSSHFKWTIYVLRTTTWSWIDSQVPKPPVVFSQRTWPILTIEHRFKAMCLSRTPKLPISKWKINGPFWQLCTYRNTFAQQATILIRNPLYGEKFNFKIMSLKLMDPFTVLKCVNRWLLFSSRFVNRFHFHRSWWFLSKVSGILCHVGTTLDWFWVEWH